MEAEVCPVSLHCPVYLNNINHNEIVGITYRKLYCLQVNKKYKVCKRYHAYLKLGTAPRSLMPNSKECSEILEAAVLAF
jgi:hypothetical protein